jgi:hypothetical protein
MRKAMWNNGDRVLGNRPPGDFWYPGTVRHSDGRRFYVIFDDGEDALLTPDQLRPLALEVGNRVYARRGPGGNHEPGRIAERTGDRLLITFADGRQARVELGQVRVPTGAPEEPEEPTPAPAPRRWEVCDRVLACWFDLDWYPGIVLAAEEDRVMVLFDTGSQVPVALDRVRRFALAVGDAVLCRRGAGPEFVAGEVTRLEGEKVQVRYDDGEEEWTSVRLLRLHRDEWFAEGGLEGLAVGNRVLACWFDLYWYPGVILSVEGKRVHITFDDGDQALVTPDRVQELKIGVGDRVFCRWRGGPAFYPGEVMQQDGEKIQVRYDDGDEEWTSVRMVRVER